MYGVKLLPAPLHDLGVEADGKCMSLDKEQQEIFPPPGIPFTHFLDEILWEIHERSAARQRYSHALLIPSNPRINTRALSLVENAVQPVGYHFSLVVWHNNFSLYSSILGYSTSVFLQGTA
jgi:hypothetical protein